MFASFVWSGSGAKEFDLRGTDQEQCCVDWGDGSGIDNYTLLGPSTDVTCSNTYASGGDHIVKIFGALSKVSLIKCQNGSVSVVDVRSLSTLKTFNFASNPIIDISSVANLPLNSFAVSNSSGFVDLSPLSSIDTLQTIYAYQCSVVDISDLPAGADFINIYLFLNSIVDISVLSNYPNLDILRLDNNSIIDISVVGAMSDLTLMRLDGNSIVTLPSSFPTWDGIALDIYDNGATFPTDDFLNKLYAAEVVNSTIDASGTNPARTSASDTAYTWLTTTGNNTITLTP